MPPTGAENPVALRALRGLLAAAHSFTTTIEGKEVLCTATTSPPVPWRKGHTGLDEEADGPWPPPVVVACTWDGGRYEMTFQADSWPKGSRYNHDLCLRVDRKAQQLIWVNLALAIRQARGSDVVIKARNFGDLAYYDALQELVRNKGLPRVTDAYVRLGTFDRATGQLADARRSFEIAVELALLKHPFLDARDVIDRGGTALIDVARWKLDLESLASRAYRTTEAEAVESDDEEEETASPGPTRALDLNLILFGPPGTGKTFTLKDHYFPLFTSERSSPAGAPPLDPSSLKWWEVLALALMDGASDVPTLVQHPLVAAKYRAQGPKAPIESMVWGALGQHAIADSATVRGSRRSGVLLFDKDDESRWSVKQELVPTALYAKRTSLSRSAPDVASENFRFVTFHQAYSYEDFIEGIRPSVTDEDDEEASISYERQAGVFKQAAENALALTGYTQGLAAFCRLPKADRPKYFAGAPRYALFIDEINRGNVARVFGELITLLEPDKRLGAEHELIVTLPSSGEPFGVPLNLHVIGTMNTADRGVEALDVALRRRFVFHECMPDPSQVPEQMADGINPRRLLETINERLEVLVDRDHVIGHAYFWPLHASPTLATLKQIFADKLVPLLQEYFFGDLGKIGLVLGRDFVTRRDGKRVRLADFDHPDRDALGERAAWDLTRIDALEAGAFRRIYEPDA